MSTPYELLARFNKDGTIAGCHVRTINTVDGKDYESDPVPLKDATDPAFTAFASSFSAGVVAERDVLATDKTKLTTDLAAKTTEHDSVKAQYDALVVASADTVAANTVTVTELKANHAQVVIAKDSDIAALQSTVAFLGSIRTYDPNIIKSEAFYQRISGDERFALGVLALTDESAKGILSLLNAYLKNEWQVLLDDPQVVGAMQYLAATGLLSEERVKELTRPASREEAFT